MFCFSQLYNRYQEASEFYLYNELFYSQPNIDWLEQLYKPLCSWNFK